MKWHFISFLSISEKYARRNICKYFIWEFQTEKKIMKKKRKYTKAEIGRIIFHGRKNFRAASSGCIPMLYYSDPALQEKWCLTVPGWNISNYIYIPNSTRVRYSIIGQKKEIEAIFFHFPLFFSWSDTCRHSLAITRCKFDIFFTFPTVYHLSHPHKRRSTYLTSFAHIRWKIWK